MSKFYIKGYRVLVEPDEIEKQTEAGIIIVQDERVEQSKLQTGVVLGIGDTCWKGESFNDPWCKVGDRILFAQHAGRFVYIDEELKLVLNDTDVIGVLE